MKRKQLIYVVRGVTGEYSDCEEWPVVAFRTRDAADALADMCIQWARANGCWMGICANKANTSPPKCPFDAHFRCDYTGTDWYVEEVELAP